jgi:D-lactate dehydrogenase (cytochrome)
MYQSSGNFHTLLIFKTDEELKVVHGLVHRMVERALALDGTCKRNSLLCAALEPECRF